MHLVFTEIQESWHNQKTILFSGPHCIIDKNLADITYSVFPFIWTQESLIQAKYHCQQMHKDILNLLYIKLNEIFNESHSREYWEIIIGPWLNNHIALLYDRYYTVHKMISNQTKFTVCGQHGAPIIPLDWNEYNYFINSDFYNFQLYTDVLNYLNIPIIKINVPSKRYNKDIKKISVLYSKILESLGKNKKYYIHTLFRSKRDELLLCFKSGFKIWPLLYYTTPYSIKPIRWDIRQKLHLKINTQDSFLQFFLAQIPKSLPMIHLEYYKELNQRISNQFKKPKVLVSGHGWKSDETFKLIAAHLKEHNGVLIGSQHGGCSGIPWYSFPEDHINEVAHVYCTYGKWGDTHPKIFPNTLGMPSPHFQVLDKINVKRKKISGILFVGTTYSRYLVNFRFGPMAGQNIEYYLDQRLFFKHLDPGIEVKLRTFDSWQSIKKLKNEFPKLMIDSFKKPYVHEVQQKNLVVIDNLNTTFSENMALNLPTLLILNPKLWICHPSSIKVLKLLEEAGILYPNPIKAAEFVNDTYSYVDDWWSDNKRQLARENFLSQYILGKEDWIKSWKDLIYNAFSRV